METKLTDKNGYVFMYATVMVVAVAAILAFLATALKPFQDKNVEIEKKQNILKSVGVIADVSEAEALYEEYIKSSFVVNSKGEKIDGDAFTTNLKVEYSKPAEKRKLPLFTAEKEGKSFLIIPLRGKGLWGPVWGYVALEKEAGNPASSFNKVFGATFDHYGETPGLGAEISTQLFQDQFPGKQLFDGAGAFKSIAIIKGGAGEGNLHGVDAISGGTITSNGVSDMIRDCLLGYEAYLRTQK